ncbi:hypothetical protein VTJ04DRAFT_5125 [Mycothermus thermophilus]|uniref:uncharacterized protein n=1 Tax=Humicola insolens TaxID=85995 RepID=UPI003743FA9F
MKFFAILSTASLVAALPAAVDSNHTPAAPELVARQLGAIENGLERGNANACPDAILIFARGSTEPGNMGITVGPALANGLESSIRNLWIQGVGGPYDAALATNFLPRGTSQANINEGKRLFALANQKCPNTPVVAGGYSQGAALIAAAVSELSGAVKEQVKGVALFGYTQNLQNRGAIPNYPRERTKIFCNVGDAVCTGTLIITPAHLSYTVEARGEAARFLRDRIRA